MTTDGRPQSPSSVRICRVFICDDVLQIRDALSEALAQWPGFAKVGDASDGLSCIDGIERCRPDVLILDVGMPGGGPDLVRAIRAIAPDVGVVVFTAYGDAATRQSMLDAGADDYVLKTGRIGPLIEAVQRAARQ